MEIKNLKNVAEVITGYTFRKALGVRSEGKMAVIQSKHVLDNLYIIKDTLPKIDLQEYQTKAIIKENDVIISARGNFRASVIRGDVIDMIASSSVYILRIKDKSILPEYLAIYLDSRQGQKQINNKTTGGAIKTISRSDLENLTISVPSKDVQNKIINLYKNNQRQQQLLTNKKILINQLIEGSISDFLKQYA